MYGPIYGLSTFFISFLYLRIILLNYMYHTWLPYIAPIYFTTILPIHFPFCKGDTMGFRYSEFDTDIIERDGPNVPM